MPILIDGNNLLHSLPSSQRDRGEVRRLIVEQTRYEKISVIVIFDGAPPAGVPSTESLGNVSIVYSGGRTADDLIVARIPKGAGAGSWAVVTNDRGLARRVRALGATIRSLSEWRHRPTGKKRRPRSKFEANLSAREVGEWEAFFSSSADDDGAREPSVVPRRKRRR